MPAIKIIAYEKPHLVQYFKNKEDAYNHGIYSNKRVDFICPCCNEVCNSRIDSFVKAEHVLCPYCNDGFPYPERFVANVLRQLGIKFVRQFKIDKYRYDFKFDYNLEKYIIEADGGIGHGHRIIDKNKDNDLIKNKLAASNGFNLIRIDCAYKTNRFEYIKHNVEEKLSMLFDLSNIDWELCNYNSVSLMFDNVIECYNTKTRYVSEIASMLNISSSCVVMYLRDAIKRGIIPKETIYKNRFDGIEDPSQYRTLYHSKKIYCYEDAKIFNSIGDAAKYYNVHVSGITQSYKGGYSANGKHFCLLYDLPDDFDFKPMTPIKTKQYSTNKLFYQYDNDGNLIDKYYGHHDLKERFGANKQGNIYRACKQGTIAYGFKWKVEDI